MQVTVYANIPETFLAIKALARRTAPGGAGRTGHVERAGWGPAQAGLGRLFLGRSWLGCSWVCLWFGVTHHIVSTRPELYRSLLRGTWGGASTMALTGPVGTAGRGTGPGSSDWAGGDAADNPERRGRARGERHRRAQPCGACGWPYVHRHESPTRHGFCTNVLCHRSAVSKEARRMQNDVAELKATVTQISQHNALSAPPAWQGESSTWAWRGKAGVGLSIRPG